MKISDLAKTGAIKVPEERKVGYKCTHCYNWEEKEREVICWKCGIGEMLFETEKHIRNQARADFLNLEVDTSKLISRERLEKIIFSTLEPVLCEKTNKGEWVIPAPENLADAILKELK